MKEFLKTMWSSSGSVSSKRFNGTIGFFIFNILVIFVTGYDFLVDQLLEQHSVTLLTTLAYISGTLLGVGMLENSKIMK